MGLSGESWVREGGKQTWQLCFSWEVSFWKTSSAKDQSFAAILKILLNNTLNATKLHPVALQFVSCRQTPVFVCACALLVGLSVYSCGRVHVRVWVHNASPCWEEWLLYSCLVGAMGARAVSLGSCMDGLRRSPSFIKHTPTCRIDLAKKQGGNSSSSVFPGHKSLQGVPPGGEVTPLSVRRSPRTTEGAGQELSLPPSISLSLIRWPQSVLWNVHRCKHAASVTNLKKHLRYKWDHYKDFGWQCSKVAPSE